MQQRDARARHRGVAHSSSNLPLDRTLDVQPRDAPRFRGRLMDRAAVHLGLDAILDVLEGQRSSVSSPADELVKLRDLPFEVEARRALVRDGKLRVVRIGRELYTTRAAIAALFESLPAAVLPGRKTHSKAVAVDDIAEAARKRAARRCA
ncbi:MAG: hypothetical protein KGL39_45415 [Patescibacteria group bacterium]|nr:hypothetical protein [Patescibacteria group bacterium]